MSFRVFAAGSGNFHYVRDNNPDMDIFNAASIASALQASGPSVSGVASGVADYYVPSDSSAYSAGVVAIAGMEFAHLMDNAVCFLAMCSGSANGWISVAPRLTHTLWPDTAAFAKYDFTPGDNPGLEFFRKIKPALEATDMNNWGVLRMLALVLSRYKDHIGDSATPMIQIQLFS